MTQIKKGIGAENKREKQKKNKHGYEGDRKGRKSNKQNSHEAKEAKKKKESLQRRTRQRCLVSFSSSDAFGALNFFHSTNGSHTHL